MMSLPPRPLMTLSWSLPYSMSSCWLPSKSSIAAPVCSVSVRCTGSTTCGVLLRRSSVTVPSNRLKSSLSRPGAPTSSTTVSLPRFPPSNTKRSLPFLPVRHIREARRNLGAAENMALAQPEAEPRDQQAGIVAVIDQAAVAEDQIVALPALDHVVAFAAEDDERQRARGGVNGVVTALG